MSHIYFSDLSVGDALPVLSVVVTSATPLKTKKGSDYLRLEVFDGREKLQGMYWDWAGNAVPELNNKVYILSVSVTEYNGSKQLTVHSIKTDTETPLTDFQPSSGKDVVDVFKEAYSFVLDNVRDDLLRDLALMALEKHKELWLTIPAATGVHHAFVGGTLIHSLSVAKLAYCMAQLIPEAHSDLCLVGGLLHDIGKLYGYDMEGATPVMTFSGKLYEHAVLGTEVLQDLTTELSFKTKDDYTKIDILAHIILSHHGTLEFGAVVEPQCMEAHIVHLADSVDARCEIIKEASDKNDNEWTDKVWALNNRCMLNYKGIKRLVPTEYDDDQLEVMDAANTQ